VPDRNLPLIPNGITACCCSFILGADIPAFEIRLVLKRTLKTSSIKPLILDSSTDHVSINDFFILLGTYGQCIRHEIVDETGVPWVKLWAAARAGGSIMVPEAPASFILCRMYSDTSSSESPV